jgi:hypothetical protein
MQKIAEQHAEFMRFARSEDPALHVGPALPPVRPDQWPSKFHHKCDIGWCGFANRPTTKPGDHRCAHPSCMGNYYVSPEVAAATALDMERRRYKKETKKMLNNLDPVDSDVLRSSGKSAMEYRTRPRVPSFSSVATAPTLVRFPHQQQQQPDSSFAPNPLHPYATSTRRAPRPSLPASRAHQVRATGQRLPSQPGCLPSNARWYVCSSIVRAAIVDGDFPGFENAMTLNMCNFHRMYNATM